MSFYIFHFRCISGCSPHSEPVVSVPGRKVFEYTCSENCVTIYSNISELWSTFILDENDEIQTDGDLIPAEGFLQSQSKLLHM